MRFDGNSLLAGAFCGAVLIAGLGAVQKGEPQTGRFQIATAENPSVGGSTAYVVDTATGAVWKENGQRYAEFLAAKIGKAE
jgi:hypothetical protein